MADDRDALIRFLDRLEQTPRPQRWYARFRRASEIRKARAVLEWDETREEGPAYLRLMRNRFVWSFTLLGVGSAGSALLFGEHALTIARVIRVVGISAAATALSLWWAARLPKRVWAYNERLHAVYLERARALPAQAGDPGPQAAA